MIAKTPEGKPPKRREKALSWAPSGAPSERDGDTQ